MVDQFGAIRDTLCPTPTPLGIEVPANQFPPETTHEVDAPPRLYPNPPEFSDAIPRTGRLFRPPPAFPIDPRPEPPTAGPHYAPVPPGIRAVFTTEAMLLRSQPETNHPIRRTHPLAPRVGGSPATLDPEAVVRRLAILLDARHEVNP